MASDQLNPDPRPDDSRLGLAPGAPPSAGLDRTRPESPYKDWTNEQLADAIARGGNLEATALGAMVDVLRDRAALHSAPAPADELTPIGGGGARVTPVKISGWLGIFVGLMAASSVALALISIGAFTAGHLPIGVVLVTLTVYDVYCVFLLLRRRPGAVWHARVWIGFWTALAVAWQVLYFSDHGTLRGGVWPIIVFPTPWLVYLFISKRVAGLDRQMLSRSNEQTVRLNRFGGWLVLLLLYVFYYSSALALSAIVGFYLRMWVMGVLWSALSIIGAYCLFQLLKRKRHAHRLTMAWLSSIALVVVCSTILDQILVDLGRIDSDGLMAGAVALIWLPYLHTSKRVAAIYGTPAGNALTPVPGEPRLGRALLEVVDRPPERSEAETALSSHPRDQRASDEGRPAVPGSREESGLVFESYRIERLLGSGATGAVYLAQQRSPHREVALKVIREDLVVADVIRRFRLEAQVLGRLHHRGIATIYEAGSTTTESGERPFIAMEYIDGQSLFDYATTRGLSPRDRLEMVVQLCDAVEHAHGRGVVHRDLKPANILVDSHGQLKVLDFGVAHLTDPDSRVTRATVLGELLGTPAYMSPEQVLAEPAQIDARSDVYALGVILYELLCGELPYQVENRPLAAVIKTVLEQEPVPLGVRDSRFRGDLETIVTKALDKDRERRYQTAAELASDIRRHLDDHAIAARRSGPVYRLGKFVRRNRVAVGSVAAALAMIIAAWHDLRAPREVSAVIKSGGTMKVVSINPPPGSRVSRDTVVVAQLSYGLANFALGQFVVQPFMNTLTPNTTTMGSPLFVEELPVTSANGTVTISFPLRRGWDDPAVAKPFVIHFGIMQSCGSMGFCAGVAHTPDIRYEAGPMDAATRGSR